MVNGYDAVVRIWVARAGTEKARLYGHKDRILALLFDPKRGSLLTAGPDKTIRSWNLQTFAQEWTLTGRIWPIRSLAIDKLGETLVSVGDWYDKAGEVIVWSDFRPK